MANWYGSARSNYFKVKDAEAFKKEMGNYDVEVWEKGGMFGLGSATEDGNWPGYDACEDVDIDIPGIVSRHLTEDSIAVFLEVGAEKLRYLTGSATAINHKGMTVNVSINDIYSLADEKLGGGVLTVAEY